ncbi:single-stranded DNA-binding protein [candidate division KSB1 bacterium]|nr:single-stranded DNA-binding protein [candidate division KSB1 bacterium]
MSDLKMPDINNVLIAGNLTSDPIFRKTANGTSVINFYIASNRKYRDNSGIWRENICYVGVVAWHRLAEACNDVLKRGCSVLIDGELQSRNWHNDDGTTRNVVELRARRIQFLDRKLTQDVEEIVAGSTDEADTEDKHPDTADKEESQTPEIQKVEPTDFDFGYQDLQL